MDGASTRSDEPLEVGGRAEGKESSIGTGAGAPTWPMPATGETRMPPPVGMNWGAVAQRYGVDVRVLMHDGYIVLAGEFAPETGYLLDPSTLQARPVDVGYRVLTHSYLIGRLTADEFRVRLKLTAGGQGAVENAVIRITRGPVVGLFADRLDARRCRDTILSGSIGSAISLLNGPIGTELRVGRCDMAGRVATTIAAHSGAVIAVAGNPLEPATVTDRSLHA